MQQLFPLLSCVGWASSTSPSLDFRTNGSALPMYGLFAVSLVVFLFGVRRHLRESGWSAREGRTTLRSFVRLLELGLLQRRLARRRYSAWTHLCLFWGFIVLALGSLAIMLDSYVLQPLGCFSSRGPGYKAFQMTLDAFGLVFVLGVSLALVRRIWIRPAYQRDDRGLPVILFVLLAMGLSGFFLEGLRIRLEGASEPWSFVGSAIAGLIATVPMSAPNDLSLYKLVWWAHAVSAFGLIAAVPFSPLRHVLTSPLQILSRSDGISGRLPTPFRLSELLSSGRFDVKVGAETAEDLAPAERLALTACAGSGRCQEVCPAHASGTTLSPMRLIEQLEREGAAAEEAIWSCTLCGACEQACPVLVDPMRFVVQLRRGLVAANRLGKRRTELLANLTYAGNPYGSNGSARGDLASELGVPTLADADEPDLLYWLGCAATFDPRARAIARATLEVLQRAGIRCAILGPEESCCGDPARRLGEEGRFQELVLANVAAFEAGGVGKIVTHCAHCFNALRNEYAEFGARIDVRHHATLIHSLIQDGRIRPAAGPTASLTLHDSCYVGRFDGKLTQPREVLRAIPGATLVEMPRSGKDAFCCGAGGLNYWYDVPRETTKEKMNASRMREARATGAQTLVTQCPFCVKMLEETATPMQVRDIAEVVAASLQRS